MATDDRGSASRDQRSEGRVFHHDDENAPPEERPSPADLRRARQPHRGRQATTPLQIPALGWKDILLRVKREFTEDQLSLVAAGVAFYFMLALFPFLLAVVAIYGVVSDPATVAQQIGHLMRVMPVDAAKLIGGQLEEITTAGGGKTGLGAALAIGLALWSAANGARAMMAGLNIAYDEEERRGFFRLRVVSLLLTIGFIGFLAVTIGVIAGLPPLLERLPLGLVAKGLAYVVTWLLMAFLVTAAFATVYRFGPSREHARWRWLTLGSIVAAVLWLLASLAFSFYASHFGSFNKTYGTLAGAVLLMLWLQITAYVTLIGAELNAEIEHQTAKDTTTGAPVPMGDRDATVADTVGEAAAAHPKRKHRERATATWKRSAPN